MTERSIKAFDYYREAEQQFEYFILGISVALCAYVGQTLKPEKLGFSPYTLEIVSLLVLVASVVIGFRRIEMMILTLADKSPSPAPR